MDDDIDATEPLHHGARDSRAAFDSGDIRSHEQVVRQRASGGFRAVMSTVAPTLRNRAATAAPIPGCCR